MAVYNLTPIYLPQWVGNAATALTLATPGAGTVVLASYNVQIAVARVANTTAAPVTLKVWRVPAGATDDDQHLVVPTINVPVASQTFPDFDVTTLWGVVLQPGDAIWMLAGSANALTVHADGVLVQI